MISFIEKANLPKGNVTSLICGELCDELNDYLDRHGIERIVIEPNLHIDPSVRFHADMSVVHLGRNKLIVDKKQTRLIELIKSSGFDVKASADEIAGEYPDDVALNFAVADKCIIGNFKCADEELLNSTGKLKRINVKQGYCKCSCLVVNEKSLITDDKTIYDKALENGFDCLLISKGDILLPGHQYGFIGGASGKISSSEVLFFGDITKHRDYKKIADFIEKHGCSIISLDFPLTDFGGIVPLSEEVNF